MFHQMSPDDFLKLLSNEERHVRIEFAGPGNPMPQIFLPKGLDQKDAVFLHFTILQNCWALFQEYFNSEIKKWFLCPQIPSSIDNMAAATTQVFRNPEFLSKLSHSLKEISLRHNRNILVFWGGREYLRAFEHEPKFEIPEPDFEECAFCGKRFVLTRRYAKKRRFCTSEHQKEAKSRRAYLRRKQRLNTISAAENKELHQLENYTV